MRYALKERSDDTLRAGLVEYPELLQHLLYSRGITDQASAQAFINPQYEAHSRDPFLMKGMEKAVEKTLSLIRTNGRIAIFSDYDADGVPGAVIMHDFLKKVGHDNFEIYIPHRHDEGFGLNKEAIEELAGRGAKLLITIDCGIADAHEVAHANSLGIDVIITDHHLPSSPDAIPKAYAVLNPKQADCAYPFKELCGTGVAFKLIQGLLARASTLNPLPFPLPPVGWEKWLLDMVGLATLSDMVSLKDENRVFAHFGLKVLRKSPRPGLQKLLRKAGVNQYMLTEDDVVFSVTPKINAASRLGSADVAFRLLSTTDESVADLAVTELMQLNNERKGIVGGLVKEVKKIIAERYKEAPSIIVAGNPNWRPALLGLVANSLAREHSCPVFLWGRDGEDEIKGSCRSDGATSVMDLMRTAREAFLEYGGHAFSGGFSVSNEAVHTLESALQNAYEKVHTEKTQEQAARSADALLLPDEVTQDTYRVIAQLSPFGHENQKPLFLMDNVMVSSARLFGKEKNHEELLLSCADGRTVKAIRFFSGDNPEYKLPAAGARVSLAVNMERSSFGGRTELRLRIVDIFN